MLQEVLRLGNFVWSDVVAPDRRQLESIAQQHRLHPIAVQSCLEPDHMPKVERYDDVDFVVIRAYDDLADGHADTVHELTRKLAVFLSKTLLLTVHRADQSYIDGARDRWREAGAGAVAPTVDAGSHILQGLLKAAILTYEQPLLDANDRLNQLEERLFMAESSSFRMREAYYLHRKGAVFRHMLTRLIDVSEGLAATHPDNALYFRDAREQARRLLFYATELQVNSQHLMNFALSVASQRLNVSSHRSNETMRVLTVFSAFFLPLNFIASIYGMNFESMPELKHPHGYYRTLAAMSVVAVVILLWFGGKGWLRREKQPRSPV